MNKLLLLCLFSTAAILFMIPSGADSAFFRSRSSSRSFTSRRSPAPVRTSSRKKLPSPPSNRRRPSPPSKSRVPSPPVRPNSLGGGNNAINTKAGNKPQTITPAQLQQKKKGYFSTWGSDLKKCTIDCLMLTAQLGMTVADFVKFGKENQLYNERQKEDKAEWERRWKLDNEEYDRRNNVTAAVQYPQNEFFEEYKDGQVCSNFDVADLNNGSMLFFCDDDGLTECCGTPGEQQCCAHTDFKSAYIVSNKATSSVNREITRSVVGVIGLACMSMLLK